MDAALKGCNSGTVAGACDQAKALLALSQQRDALLNAACTDPASAQCLAATQEAVRYGNTVIAGSGGKTYAYPTGTPMASAGTSVLDNSFDQQVGKSTSDALILEGGNAVAAVIAKGAIAAGKATIGLVSDALGGIAPTIDAGIVWGRGINGQGMPWEDYLAAQMPPATRLPANFKTFDFYDDATRTAISAKTLDTTTAARVANPEQIYASLKGSIDAAADFTTYTLNRTSLNVDLIASRQIQVAVPANTTPAQWAQIDKAILYGQGQGVKVIVTPVKGPK